MVTGVLSDHPAQHADLGDHSQAPLGRYSTVGVQYHVMQ
jgi:hypothetical protein